MGSWSSLCLPLALGTQSGQLEAKDENRCQEVVFALSATIEVVRDRDVLGLCFSSAYPITSVVETIKT